MNDDLLREMHARGETMPAIAKALGCSRMAVLRRARKLGLPRRMVEQGTLPTGWIVARYLDGMTADEITEQLRPRFPTLAASTVLDQLRLRGVEIRKAARRAKHTPAMCVRMVRNKFTRAQIAARFGISVEAVGGALAKVWGRPARADRRKFDHDQIREMAGHGMTSRQIAMVVGCSKATAAKVIASRVAS